MRRLILLTCSMVIVVLSAARQSLADDASAAVAATLEAHPIEYRNALFGAMESESAVLGYPGDGLFTTTAELVNAGETGYAVYLTADPAAPRPGADAVQYHFTGAEKKGGDERAGKLGDLLVLGDYQKPYYLNKRGVEDTDTGFVYIFYFDTEHATVRLHGEAGDYELVALDELPRAERDSGRRFGKLMQRFGGERASRFTKLRQRRGKSRASGGTAIVWHRTQDLVGVLVGVQPDELDGGLQGSAFEYDRKPAAEPALTHGVQVRNPGLFATGRYTAAAPNGDTYLVGSAPSGVPGVIGDGVLYVGRFAPDGEPRWQRHIGGSESERGEPVAGDTPADLVALNGKLYIVTVRRLVGSVDGVAGKTNSTRVYAIDGDSGRLLDLYEPRFKGGRRGEDAWSAGSGIAADHAGHLYISGEYSAGHSATPFLLKLDADDLTELWRMGAYDNPGAQTAKARPKENDRRRGLRRLLKMRRGRSDETQRDRNTSNQRGGGADRLLKEAWGGVAFWQDPDGAPGEGIAYISGYRWDSAESPLTAWLAAVSPDGEKRWLKELGGNGYEWPWATAADREGNVFIAGITTSRTGLHTTGPEPQGSGEGFIAKYNKLGEKLWVRCVTSPEGEEVKDLHVEGDNLYAIGHTFGGLVTGATHRGRSDIYVARYDLDGNRLHAATLGTERHDRATFDIRDGVIHVGGRTFGSMAREKDTAGVEPFAVRLDARTLQPLSP